MNKKKKIIMIILAIFIVSSIGIFYKMNLKFKNRDKVELFGNVEVRQVDLSFQVEGRIKDMLKEEGDYVKKNELVAVLDKRDYEANFKKVSADVLKAKASYENAQSQYTRQAPLVCDDTISEQAYDTLLNTRDNAKANYEATLAQKQEAKNKLDYTQVYAPEDGIITTRIQEAGANVAKNQAIYTLSKHKPVWIRAFISEVNLGNIKYGMEARVLTDSIDPKTGKRREYKGFIGYISPVAEFTPKTVQTTDLRTDLVYRIRVYVYDVDFFLRQGMPTTIKIDLKQTPNKDEEKIEQRS